MLPAWRDCTEWVGWKQLIIVSSSAHALSSSSSINQDARRASRLAMCKSHPMNPSHENVDQIVEAGPLWADRSTRLIPIKHTLSTALQSIDSNSLDVKRCCSPDIDQLTASPRRWR